MRVGKHATIRAVAEAVQKASMPERASTKTGVVDSTVNFSPSTVAGHLHIRPPKKGREIATNEWNPGSGRAFVGVPGGRCCVRSEQPCVVLVLTTSIALGRLVARKSP
jgi:hypothetical protein